MRQSYRSNCSLGITKLRWLPGEFEEINRLHGARRCASMRGWPGDHKDEYGYIRSEQFSVGEESLAYALIA